MSMKWKNSELSSYPFISSYNFMLMADHVSLGDDPQRCAVKMNDVNIGIDPSKVKEGDILYVITDNLPQFFRNIYPNIKNNFILISGRTDRPLKNIYDDKKIIKWYTSNLGVKHDKVEAIPLGLQNRHWRTIDNPEGDPEFLKEAQSWDIEKKKDVLMGFQPRSNHGVRAPLYNKFKDKKFVTKIDYGQQDRKDKSFRERYYKLIKKHKFVLCPQGAGFDCHRNWETLYLGSYPIIKKHISMKNFYDMPIWFVDNWNEVTPDNIDKKWKELNDDVQSGKRTFDKAYFDYWFKKIKTTNDIEVGQA